MRIIGNNSHGFQNERDIRNALDMKIVDSINPNLKKFLQDMFPGQSLSGKRVHANVVGDRGKIHYKPDFYVTIDNVDGGRYVSVKNEGSGHSLHQENIDTFIPFLREIGVTENIILKLLFYHWSDETYNNTGITRYNAKTFTKAHKALVDELNDYFKSHSTIRNKIVERCVFTGKEEDAPHTDFLYQGNCRNGVWASRKEIFDYSDSLPLNYNGLHIGPITYQIWNANLTRKFDCEYKRKSVQFKWGKLKDSLLEIGSRRADYLCYGTYDGDLSEKASVILFNKDPESAIFKDYLKKINKEPENVLLIRVTTNQLSRLSNQRVKTRADAYAIEIIDSRIYDLLEENDYYLDEDILNGYDEYYRCVEKSGISIKRDNSENYTLIKLTPNSFNELFGTYVLGYGASIFCKNSNELNFNIPLLDGWHVTVEELQDYFDTDRITEQSLSNSLELCKNIKDICIERIKSTIDGSVRLQSIIFNGKDIYDEPYSAFFFMQNNLIRTLGYIPYNVTTGSGRTHGQYSLVLKPR